MYSDTTLFPIPKPFVIPTLWWYALDHHLDSRGLSRVSSWDRKLDLFPSMEMSLSRTLYCCSHPMKNTLIPLIPSICSFCAILQFYYVFQTFWCLWYRKKCRKDSGNASNIQTTCCFSLPLNNSDQVSSLSYWYSNHKWFVRRRNTIVVS